MVYRELKLAHLYPKELNLYGDIGNIIALKKRCEWRGVNLVVEEINIGDDITAYYDMYFIGGGQDKQQVNVSIEIQRHKEFLFAERDRNAVFLGICGGYQLLGSYYQLSNGERLLGLGLLDAYTVTGDVRMIGNVTCEVDFINPKSLVGFENHIGQTYLQGETKSLAKVLAGKGNNIKDDGEGARYKNVFGTYLHGALLPKNPQFADYLIGLALKNRYDDASLISLDDELENCAHKSVFIKK